MIQLNKTQIFFSLPQKGLVGDDHPSLALPLEYGHVCPNCGTVIQALFRTDQSIDKALQKHFRSEKELALNKMAVSTPLHQISPKYFQCWEEIAGGGVQVILEEFHWNICTTKHSGQCKYTASIFRRDFDPVYYTQRLINIETQSGWHPIYDACLANTRKLLGTGAAALAQDILQFSSANYGVATDVTGRVAPVYLMSRSDWSSYRLESYLKAALEKHKDLQKKEHK